MALIPVSAARAERDAIAAATAADAARRQGADRLQWARRIAAALNVPVDDGMEEIGFFWVTGLTVDGAIVVANSYGLAYIPDGVQLPEEVFMASADETIPVAERARWATYPVLAVQAWAAHHGAKLRAVIATQEQLSGTDAGAPKVLLEADDIPDSGTMVGRSRLEVVDPKVAERLADMPDAALTASLPPPPEDVGPPAVKVPTAGDAGPPADQRPILWSRMVRPLVSSASGRGVAHVRAFHTYAAYAQRIILKEAHAAVDPVAQRQAVADWLYWKHLTGLLDAALANAV